MSATTGRCWVARVGGYDSLLARLSREDAAAAAAGDSIPVPVTCRVTPPAVIPAPEREHCQPISDSRLAFRGGTGDVNKQCQSDVTDGGPAPLM